MLHQSVCESFSQGRYRRTRKLPSNSFTHALKRAVKENIKSDRNTVWVHWLLYKRVNKLLDPSICIVSEEFRLNTDKLNAEQRTKNIRCLLQWNSWIMHFVVFMHCQLNCSKFARCKCFHCWTPFFITFTYTFRNMNDLITLQVYVLSDNYCCV